MTPNQAEAERVARDIAERFCNQGNYADIRIAVEAALLAAEERGRQSERDKLNEAAKVIATSLDRVESEVLPEAADWLAKHKPV